MSSVGNLVVSIVGDIGQLKKAFAEVGNEVNQLGGKLQSAGKQMSAAGMSLTKNVTAPLLAIGGSAVYAANEMDKAYKSIRVGTGATGEALEALRGDFKGVLGEVPASVEDVGIAIADLHTRLGLTGEPLQLMSKQMLELSRITGEDLSGTIESTTRVFGDWGVAVGEQTESLDYLFKVSQSTGISIGELSRNMVQYGAPLRQMGFDYDTAAALIGKFNKEGVNTELVMGSLRIALGKMAKEGITDANEALRTITEQIKKAGSASEANALAIEYFGARAGPDMAAAIREGRFEVDELVNTLRGSSETIMKAGEDSLTFGDKLQMMKVRIFEALEPLGKKILEIFEQLEPFIYGLINLLTKLLDGFSNLPGPVQTMIIAIAGIAAAIGPILLVLGPLISGVGGLLTFIGGAGGLTAIVGGLGATLSGVVGVILGPVGIALAALALAAYLIYKNWDKIGPVLKDTFDQIKEAVAPVVQAFKEFVSDALEQIRAWWEANGETITAGIEALISVLGTLVSFIVNRVAGTVKTVLPPILSLVKYILTQIGNLVVLFAQLITGDWSGAWNTIQKITQTAMDFVSSIISSMMGGILNTVSSMGGNLRNIVSTVLNSIYSTLSGVLSSIVSFLVNAMSSMLSGWSSGWSNIVAALQNAVNSIFTALSNAVSTFYNIGAAWIQSLIDGIKSKISSLTSAVSSALSFSSGSSSTSSSSSSSSGSSSSASKSTTNTVTSTLSSVSSALSSAASTAASAGSSIMSNLASGITSAASKVTSAVSSVVSSVRNYFPFSPAKEGALKKLPNWDAFFVDPILESTKGLENVVQSRMNDIAGMVPPIAAGQAPGTIGTAGSQTNNIGGNTLVIQNMTLSKDYPFEQFMRDYESRMTQARVQRGIRG